MALAREAAFTAVAVNGNVQAAKRKAKDYRTKRTLKAIVYLIAGDVQRRAIDCCLATGERAAKMSSSSVISSAAVSPAS
jgi:hypothetical protein